MTEPAQDGLVGCVLMWAFLWAVKAIALDIG